MAYTITTTAGATLAIVADGTVNTTTTSLTLIGKNYAGYGIFLNENYVKLLENFSNSTAPNGALTGQLWYDNANSVLKVYGGPAAGWKPISSSAASATAPTNNVTGDLWWDTTNSQLKVWSGATWVTIGPAYTSSAGLNGAIPETILDNASPTPQSHYVIKFYVNNAVIAILSKDATFTPGTGISGFTTIKPGFNLISPSTLSGAQYSGTAEFATALSGGLTGSSFLRSDQDTTTAFKISAGNLVVASSLNITTAGGAVQLVNSTLNSSTDFYINRGGSNLKAIGINGTTGAISLGTSGNLSVTTTGATVTGNLTVAAGFTNLQGVTVVSGNVVPSGNNTVSLGTTSSRFSAVWATSVTASSSTAVYADLAERFEADAEYMPGTVVELGGLKEITAAIQELSDNVFGVISTLPGFLMNGMAGSNQTHPPVAVNGRVPVRVVGTCKKGDRLVAAGNGLARAAKKSELTAFNVIGRALEDKTSIGEDMVEAIVKLNS